MDLQSYVDWSADAPNGVSARYFSACDSTNVQARLIAESSTDRADTWVVAGEQSAGRGRRGREWSSNAGNFFGSKLWFPKKSVNFSMLPYQVALAIRETLVKLGAANDVVKCKWPNDILINEKKASGVLIEASTGTGGKPDYVVIGIGINLVHFPEEAQFPATSLMRETGIAADINTVFQILSNELNGLLSVDDNEAVIRAWENESWGLGQVRQVNLIDERFEAKLLSLRPDGGLLVRKLSRDEELIIYAGDIFENYPDDERQS